MKSKQPGVSGHHKRDGMIVQTTGRKALKLALRRPIQSQYRGFLSEAIGSLSNGFIELALASPFAPSLPPYTTTIVTLTAVTRISLILPLSIWSKRRQWRLEEEVLPRLQSFRISQQRALSKKLAPAKEHALAEQFREYKSTLMNKYKCSPWSTILVPQIANLPIFILSTIVYQTACAPPSPLDSESVFTLTSLTGTDPTGTLPIIIGLLTLANVETSHWLVGGQHARDVLQRSEALAKQDAEKGIVRIRPQAISKNLLRAFSIMRIVISMVMPGAVAIYWTSSSAFALLQTWAFDFWEGRRKANLKSTSKAVESTSHHEV